MGNEVAEGAIIPFFVYDELNYGSLGFRGANACSTPHLGI